MKQRYLLLGILLFLILQFDGKFQFIAAILTVIYWLYAFNDRTVFLVLICISILFFREYVHLVPEKGVYTVIQSNAYSATLRKGLMLLKTENSVSLFPGDKVLVKGNIEPVESRPSFYSKDPRITNAIQGIFYKTDADEIAIIQKSQRVEYQIWERINRIEDKEIKAIYRQLLFHYNDPEIENSNSLSSLIYSTGSSLSLSVHLLQRTLNFFIYPVYSQLIVILSLLVMGVRNGFTCSILRIFLKHLFSFLKDKKDRTGIIMILLLLYNPYYSKSLAFLIPISYSVINCFVKDRFISSFVLFFVHLYNKAVVYPIQSLLYRSLRILIYIMQWGLTLNLLLKSSLIYSLIQTVYKELNLFEDQFLLNGKASLGLLILAFIVGCRRRNTKKHTGILCLLLLINQYKGFFTIYDEVVFLDVGQGDSILFKPSFSTTATILDTGSSYQKNRVYNELNYYGLHQLDCILSHNDEDHSGNLFNIMKQYKISHLFTEKQEHISTNRLDFLGLLSDVQLADINANSLILYTRIGGLYYLFTGDGTTETEEKIVTKYPGLKVDIFKAGHHGSETSNTELLLSKIHPDLCLISCGDFHIYHHPSPSVLKRLKDLRIPYLTTRTCGDIRIISLFKYNLLLTANGVHVVIVAK